MFLSQSMTWKVMGLCLTDKWSDGQESFDTLFSHVCVLWWFSGTHLYPFAPHQNVWLYSTLVSISLSWYLLYLIPHPSRPKPQHSMNVHVCGTTTLWKFAITFTNEYKESALNSMLIKKKCVAIIWVEGLCFWHFFEAQPSICQPCCPWQLQHWSCRLMPLLQWRKEKHMISVMNPYESTVKSQKAPLSYCSSKHYQWNWIMYSSYIKHRIE